MLSLIGFPIQFLIQAKYEVGYSWEIVLFPNYRIESNFKIWSKVYIEGFAKFRVPFIIEIGV